MEEKLSLLLLLHFPRSPDQFPTDVLILERPKNQQTPRWQLFTPDNGVQLVCFIFIPLQTTFLARAHKHTHALTGQIITLMYFRWQDKTQNGQSDLLHLHSYFLNFLVFVGFTFTQKNCPTFLSATIIKISEGPTSNFKTLLRLKNQKRHFDKGKHSC